MTECTHQWQTCPAHNPDGGLPDLITVTTCLYGDLETKDGDKWNDDDSREVWDRVFTKLTGQGLS